MSTYSHLVIERKTTGPEWEPYAYPTNHVDEAKRVLAGLREQESRMRYKRPLRLVRVTREYIDSGVDQPATTKEGEKP